MLIIAIIVAVVICYMGLWQNERDKDYIYQEYSIFPMFLAGFFGVLLVVGVVLLIGGIADAGIGLTLSGLLGTILFEVKWLNSAAKVSVKAKKAGYSGSDLFKLGPVHEWIQCTMWGIGKFIKFFLYCTVFGILIVKFVDGNVRLVQDIDKQYELRNKKEYLKLLEDENATRRAAEEIIEKNRKNKEQSNG